MGPSGCVEICFPVVPSKSAHEGGSGPRTTGQVQVLSPQTVQCRCVVTAMIWISFSTLFVKAAWESQAQTSWGPQSIRFSMRCSRDHERSSYLRCSRESYIVVLSSPWFCSSFPDWKNCCSLLILLAFLWLLTGLIWGSLFSMCPMGWSSTMSGGLPRLVRWLGLLCLCG